MVPGGKGSPSHSFPEAAEQPEGGTSLAHAAFIPPSPQSLSSWVLQVGHPIQGNFSSEVSRK